MQRTIKQLIQLNNEKRKLLNEHNEKYYEDLLVYIRMGLFRDERATEEVLFEMLDHLILAQQDGKTAEQVFGKQPKQLANEILETLPRESTKSITQFFIEIAFQLLGIYFAIVGILPMIKQQEQTVYLGNLSIIIISLLIGLVFMIGVVKFWIQKEAFANKKKSRATYILVCCLFAAIAAIIAFIIIKVDELGPALIFGPYTYFGLGCFLMLASYLMKKMREATV